MAETCIRQLDPADVNYVSSTWLKSYATRSRPGAKGPGFFSAHQPVVVHLLATAQTLVACDPIDPTLIQAWCCFDRRADGLPVVHYVYVKGVFRGLGLGKALVGCAVGATATKSLSVVATHASTRLPHVVVLAGDVHLKVLYDPHSIVNR